MVNKTVLNDENVFAFFALKVSVTEIIYSYYCYRFYSPEVNICTQNTHFCEKKLTVKMYLFERTSLNSTILFENNSLSVLLYFQKCIPQTKHIKQNLAVPLKVALKHFAETMRPFFSIQNL